MTKRNPGVIVWITLATVLVAGWSAAQTPFAPAVGYAVGPSPGAVALGDFDGDGMPDMVATSDAANDALDKVMIRLNTGMGIFGPATEVFMGNISGGTGPHGVAATDLDNDLDLDVIVTLKKIDSVQVLVNNNGVFSLGQRVGVSGLLPRDVVVGDLDGNGFADVVTSNRDSNTVSVLLNNAGTLSVGVSYDVAAGPRGLALGDLNGDGNLDIAVAGSSSREVSILLNSGGGAFSMATPLSVGTELRPEGVTARDLNSDGLIDVAASSSGGVGDFVSVFLNLGGGTFAPRADYPTGGLNPGGIAAADFDTDGKNDLTTANQDSGTVSFLANIGGAGFGTPAQSAVGTSPGTFAVSDIDGNGSADLAVSNADSDSVSVLLNLNSALLFSDGLESGSASAWSAAVGQ